MTQIDEVRDRKVLLYDAYECSYIYLMTQEMLYTKAGEFKEEDVSNFLKASEDAVFEYMLENDKNVVTIHGHKRLTLLDPLLVVLVSEGFIDDTVWHAEIPFSIKEFIEPESA